MIKVKLRRSDGAYRAFKRAVSVCENSTRALGTGAGDCDIDWSYDFIVGGYCNVTYSNVQLYVEIDDHDG